MDGLTALLARLVVSLRAALSLDVCPGDWSWAVSALGVFVGLLPTVGLVAKMFGTANMAMLFGVVMLSHQVGGFLGAYLGGYIFQATGSYDWVWYIDIVLAVGAALVNLPIREALLPRQMAAKAAA